MKIGEIDWLLELPQKLESSEDVARVYRRFAEAANNFVFRRLPFKEKSSFGLRRFYADGDIRFWHERDLEELAFQVELPEEEKKRLLDMGLIPCRVALNYIRDLKDQIKRLRED